MGWRIKRLDEWSRGKPRNWGDHMDKIAGKPITNSQYEEIRKNAQDTGDENASILASWHGVRCYLALYHLIETSEKLDLTAESDFKIGDLVTCNCFSNMKGHIFQVIEINESIELAITLHSLTWKEGHSASQARHIDRSLITNDKGCLRVHPDTIKKINKINNDVRTTNPEGCQRGIQVDLPGQKCKIASGRRFIGSRATDLRTRTTPSTTTLKGERF